MTTNEYTPEEIEELENLTLAVGRGYLCANEADIAIKDFSSFVVSCQCSNVGDNSFQRRRGFNSLFGYIPYELASEKVSCSGRHGYYGNDVKVLIARKYNNKGDYKRAYNYALTKLKECDQGYLEPIK